MCGIYAGHGSIIHQNVTDSFSHELCKKNIGTEFIQGMQKVNESTRS
jgi:hypothetical protein